MKTTIEQIKKLPGIVEVQSHGCVIVSIFEQPEAKPEKIFVNSENEGFAKGDMCHYFDKRDYSLHNGELTSYRGVRGDDTFSESYKSEETAYQKSVEYAHEQGETIENDIKDGNFNVVHHPIWNWTTCHYRIQQDPSWLTKLWIENPNIAKAAAKELGYKNRG